jgi:hypothetical protein
VGKQGTPSPGYKSSFHVNDTQHVTFDVLKAELTLARKHRTSPGYATDSNCSKSKNVDPPHGTFTMNPVAPPVIPVSCVVFELSVDCP